ncbi:MAG: biopolymer transporter ExbD [Paludibacteraceae bacterium]|nr:biopolymer transporter ExbD [Paludibacteraceae bacterium]
MGKRKVQEINASSMADIAFLLLIFFLVTTTMSVDKGLSRRLPPPLPPNMEKPDIDVKKRNIFIVLVNSNNQLLVQGEPLDVKQLKEKAKLFIQNEANDASLPEKVPVEVEFDGIKETLLTTKNHVISLQNDRGTQYQKYIEVQNELVAAYNELRNEMAQARFGMKYDELDENRQKAIQTIYPQKISEAEPKNYGGKK